MNTATMKKTKGQPAKQVTPYLSYLSTPARTRTADKLIKSQLLYQLSYGGICSPGCSQTGTPARTRTADKLIKSQLLYQLSYGGTLSVSTLHPVFLIGRSRWSDLN